MGVAASDEPDATAADTEAGERLVPTNQLPKIVEEPPAAVDTEVLIAAAATVAAASPAVPGGNVSRTLAVDDPGITATATSLALGNCAIIAACTVATSAVVSALANVI